MKALQALRLAVTPRGSRLLRLASLVMSVLAGCGALGLATAAPSSAAGPQYVPIIGNGSTWVEPAMHAWVTDVNQYAITVNYIADGSSSGRNAFKAGTADYGASEIPYGVRDGNNFDPPPTRGYAYIPDAAGGTTFMYNLQIDGKRVTDLRLSGAVIAGIFTNQIKMWNDPRIKADNPALNLPPLQITPVVRSDGSGATAQFTQWMIATEGSFWTAYCVVVSRNPCTQTSTYPVEPNTAMVGVAGDNGVAGYVAASGSDGAIGYVEYSYALETGFPVAKVLNADGYYTEPTPGHVAVSLLKAQINTDASSPTYLTQNLSQVYTDRDPRTYELSSYSYMIIPTDLTENMTTAKGFTLGAFGSFLLCIGQSQVDALGYSALPIDLVERGFNQLRRIPGNNVPPTNVGAIAQCHNPTFSTNGTNTLAVTDPFPPSCDKQGSQQCTTATGGAGGGNGGGGGGGTGGGTGGGGGGNGGGGNGAGPVTKTCDPNTGICTTSSGTANGPAGTNSGNGSEAGPAPSASPLDLSASEGNGTEVTLMALAAGIAFLVSATPPLIAQASRRRRRRRGYEDSDWQGEG